LLQEFYDFLNLAVPIRKVPDSKIHICPPEVLALLGLDEEGAPVSSKEESSEEVDPRWAALKKLKFDK